MMSGFTCFLTCEFGTLLALASFRSSAIVKSLAGRGVRLVWLLKPTIKMNEFQSLSTFWSPSKPVV